MEKPINVLVMGKVPIVCSAISNTITRNFKESFVMITPEPIEALHLNEIVSFNLLIIDGDEYSSEELTFMADIKKIRSKVKIVIILFDESDKTVRWYFKNGANALLSKYSSEEKIVKTINLSINGHNHFINDLKIRVTSAKPIKEHQLVTKNEKQLSTREYEIACLLSKGHKNKFISDTLNITESSVSTYKKRIFLKTSTSNVFELIHKLQTKLKISTIKFI